MTKRPRIPKGDLAALARAGDELRATGGAAPKAPPCGCTEAGPCRELLALHDDYAEAVVRERLGDRANAHHSIRVHRDAAGLDMWVESAWRGKVVEEAIRYEPNPEDEQFVREWLAEVDAP